MSKTGLNSLRYAQSYAHLGNVQQSSEGALSYLVRHIPETPFCDAMTAPSYLPALADTNPHLLVAHLRDAEIVSFVGCFAPDQKPTSDWTQAGFETIDYKTHFVHYCERARPELSTRSRRNVTRARRIWKIERVSLAEQLNEIAQAHEEMLSTKNVLSVSSHPLSTLRAWANLPEIETFGARDEAGFGVWAVAIKSDTALHLLRVAAHSRAYRTGGFYALYDFLTGEHGPRKTIYCGGTPANQPGLARFKGRFCNGRAAISIAQIVLRPNVYQDLNRQFGVHNWFPSYRTPLQSKATN